MIEQELISNLTKAVEKTVKEQNWNLTSSPEIKLEKPKENRFGSYSSTIAFNLSKILKKEPQEIALSILKNFSPNNNLEKIEGVGGYINIYLNKGYFYSTLREIIKRKENYGKSELNKDKKVQIEFISANPTGPLHVGQGRIGVLGDTLANLLNMVGYKVEKEYYVNDAETSSQIAKLGESLEIRYRQLLGEEISMPDDCYVGDYLIDLAKDIIKDKGEEYLNLSEQERKKFFRKIAVEKILEGQKETLIEFGIKFDNFFSEQSLYEGGDVEEIITKLKERNYIYEQDKALWFKSSEFSDEKDRVIVRSSNEPTYLASDIAYHKNKYERGYDKIINIWGADHHGYLKRLKGAIKALGYDESKMDLIIVQLVNLYEGGEPVRMSKRTGELVCLKELINEVGCDAARFFFLTRDSNTPLDFDIDIAKKKSEENPVYYVQYAHCRCVNILKNAMEKGISLQSEKVNLELLDKEEEINLIKKLSEFPDIVREIASSYQVHKLTIYARDLAQLFHIFYHNHRVISDNKELTQARLFLVEGVRIVLKNLLTLMGISRPERM